MITNRVVITKDHTKTPLTGYDIQQQERCHAVSPRVHVHICMLSFTYKSFKNMICKDEPNRNSPNACCEVVEAVIAPIVCTDSPSTSKTVNSVAYVILNRLYEQYATFVYDVFVLLLHLSLEDFRTESRFCANRKKLLHPTSSPPQRRYMTNTSTYSECQSSVYLRKGCRILR